MSWVRSATSLIGFGFTIVQVIERLQTVNLAKPVLVPEMPRNLGLALIGAGVIGLAIGIAQYRKFVAHMWSDDFKGVAGLSGKRGNTPIIPLAILVEIVGIVAFVTVLFRLS